MSIANRRTVLTAAAAATASYLGGGFAEAGATATLRFRPFEDAVRDAFAGAASGACHRIEIGHCDQLQAGLQSCCNDRPFAGFATGRLRIVQTGSEPGPVVHGVRLYVATVDVALLSGFPSGRPLDFSSIPPAPTF